jgi:hypothetical protein
MRDPYMQDLEQRRVQAAEQQAAGMTQLEVMWDQDLFLAGFAAAENPIRP